jgi:prolyl-tRNA synthetase
MVTTVVREEMDAAGAQEVLLPIIQPAELWRMSGRWSDYGAELFRVRDRHDREFALGPTHEEIITDLVKGEVRSYRQLPLCLYQINTKFRDEIRPRFGVMRAREFMMKDAYSFDRDQDGLERTYERMHLAYRRIFARLGLDARPALADPGAIGGTGTHEFIVQSDTGEVTVVACPDCDYLANVEQAVAGDGKATLDGATALAADASPGTGPKLMSTPGAHTVAAVTALLGVKPSDLIKTMIVSTPSGKHAAGLVRGDHEIALAKLARILGEAAVEFADPATVTRVTGAAVGFAGPIGLHGVKMVVDPAVQAMVSAVVGANQADAHLTGVRPGVDFTWDEVADIRTVEAGDPCPLCGSPLLTGRGIEVGQIFRLGTKYSERFGATYSDESGTLRPMVMGCYGVGISRTVAAMIEHHHDGRGITWPATAAPYTVVVIPVNDRDKDQCQTAARIYEELLDRGVTALLDDRAERAGVKFNDADLLGWPFRITVGRRAATDGVVEITTRVSGQTELLPVDAAATEIATRLGAAQAEQRAQVDLLR